jgi:hypothetical protein
LEEQRAAAHDGIGTGCSNSNTPGVADGVARGSALISAVRPGGTVSAAVYVNFAPGVSWHGSSERAWIAWHCCNAGATRCKAATKSVAAQ